MQVARWYCRRSQTTFSLLPDCLASQLRGSLDTIEAALVTAQEVGVAAAEQRLRLDEEVGLAATQRWLAHRRKGVGAVLRTLVTAYPDRLGAVTDIRQLRLVLGTDRALVALRHLAVGHLQVLAPPLGLCPRRQCRTRCARQFQHETGSDPPPPRRDTGSPALLPGKGACDDDPTV